jgi:DNA-binding MarR family transcriptional regulator
VGRITAATGLTRSIVEQAVNALAVRGLVASKPRPSRRRRTAPARATDQVAKTG